MRRHRWRVTVVLCLLAAAPAPQHFDAGNVGGPASNKPAELFEPTGPGPFPAMVVLHPCSGVGPHARNWARRLVGWGYVAIVVDSFRPRGVTNVCNHGMDIPPTLQAVDGFAAADYLRSLPNVRGDRIGVVGFSHGGWAVLKAVLESPGYRPFAAAVAFYPGCDPPGAPLVTDTLILIGDADDWTPARRCLRWREMAHTNGHALPLTVYPGALHSFDSATPPHMYAGHLIGRDPAAAEDAFARTREFLAERLMP